jgi:CHASE2 domain-containing sensor protein
MATGFDRRRPRTALLIRVLVTAWLLALTIVLVVTGHWPWALVTLAGAVANAALGYRAARMIRRP